MEQDVIGLQVPVHNVVLVEDLKGLDELLEILHGLCLGELLFLLEELFEGAPITELIHEVEVVVGLEHLDVPHDVGRRLDARQRVDFVDSALFEFGVFLEALHRDHLDRKLLLGLDVHCFVHFTVDALPDLLVQ